MNDARSSGSKLGNYRYPPADEFIPLETSMLSTAIWDDVTSNKLQDLSCEIDHQVWHFRVHMQ